MDRAAIAEWKRPGSDAGTLTTDSGALLGVPFSPAARFELEATPTATTPEELLAAAVASCFTMTLARRLTDIGYAPAWLRVEARCHLVRPSGYWEIPAIRMHCSAKVPGIGETEFLAAAHEARVQGPIARTLRADITLTTTLEPLTFDVWAH